MADDRLRLEAEVKDNASATLRKIAKELEAIRETPGMRSARDWVGKFQKASAEFRMGTSGIAAGLSSINIGGLAAGASIGGLISSFKGLADRVSDMREIARQTGLTTDQVNQLRRAADLLHVDPEKMTGGLQKFSENLTDARRGMGDMYGQLNAFAPEFAAKLRKDNPMQAVQDAMKWLSAQSADPVNQKRWTELMFGSGDISRMFSDGWKGVQDAMDRAGQGMPHITEEMKKQAEALHTSLVEFNDAVENLELRAGPTVFKAMREAADDIRQSFGSIVEVWKQAEPYLKEANKPMGSIAHDARDRLKDAIFGRESTGRAHLGAPDQDPMTPRGATGSWVEDRPWRGAHGQDGNALHRWDETPAQNPLLHKSAFTTSGDGGGLGSGMLFEFERSIREGTKTGIMAGLLEFAERQDLQNGGGGGGGISQAAYHTGGGSGGGGGGFGGRSGGNFKLGALPGQVGDAETRERLNFIREQAQQLGINPDIAQRVATSEGLFAKGVGRPGDHGTSFGDFQLHYGGGLGDIFTKMTGLDARDPKNWRQADAFALQWASKHGWSDWHGWRGDPRAGIGQPPSGSGPDWMTDRSKRELSGINKDLANDLLSAADKTGIHFQIAQGLRSQEEANRNAMGGRGVRDSQHLYGAAADIHLLDGNGRETYDRGLYQRFADAYVASSRAHGGQGRWLGNQGGRWGSDIVHFDQGLGYGQSHPRDPFGAGGPMAADVQAGNEEAYRSAQNPFLHGNAAQRMLDARQKHLDDLDQSQAGMRAQDVGYRPGDLLRRSGGIGAAQEIKHTGGATIEIRGLPQGRGSIVKTHGLIEAVNLRRGPTMASTV